MPFFLRFCAFLFLIKSLNRLIAFASVVPAHQPQVTPRREMPKFLDGSAALGESEEDAEENAFEGGAEGQFEMEEWKQQKEEAVHRQGEDIGQIEENGSREKGQELLGVKITDKTVPSFAVPSTRNGPTPPLAKQRPFGRETNRLSERTMPNGVRAFASGRYEPPAQRPPMVPRMPSHQPDDDSFGVSAHKKLPSPQLSFRSPTGQYAPLWSPAGAAFAVPSPAHLGGIAYYAPNSGDGMHGTTAAEAAAHPIAGGQPMKPPVLLIGAFPPSAKVRPFLSPSSHFVSHYSPPNPPPLSAGTLTNFSDEFVAQSAAPPPNLYQPLGEQRPTNYYEKSSTLPHHFPSAAAGNYVGSVVPPSKQPPLPSYFPTLVTAQSEFAVPTPSIGRFIPGRPYQPSRRGGGALTTKVVPITTTTTTTAKPTEAPRGDCEQTDFPPLAPQPTEGPQGAVPNRSIGKARIICMEKGVQFALRTLFPFTGQIFAYEKKRIASCFFSMTNEPNINISFPFSECGIRNRQQTQFSTPMEQFHLQIVLVFHQQNASSNVQSFFVQCAQNRENGGENERQAKLGRNIEEALDELNIVPIELEQKAPLPTPTMRFLVDQKKEGDDGVEANDELQIGQPMLVEFALQPKTAAFGFLVKNCVVKDTKRGIEHEVIDSFGCSTDLNIFGHLRYDTYNDIARANWHAFKLPDQSELALKCRVLICTDLADPSEVPFVGGCAALPSPPFCPDLATSPSDSVLADLSPASFARRLRRTNFVAGGIFNATVANWSSPAQRRVRTSLCVGNESDSNDGTQFCHRFLAEAAENLSKGRSGVSSAANHRFLAPSTFLCSFTVFALFCSFAVKNCAKFIFSEKSERNGGQK
ncbi:hypothetical protein niasHT_014032 [Heterodera trifolii]|uniref:ZP domain-containing protein n=1 Tax=Heterodera trifolii TaxID=157864 RepID=A0ABD2LG44_9BILA